MSMQARKSLKKLVCAGIVGLVLVGCAKEARGTLVNSNSIVEDGIEYYIQTDKCIYNLGENVEMLFRVTNLTENPVDIGDVPNCVYGWSHFIITDHDNNEIWQWLRAIPPCGWIMFHLEPYESKECQKIWNMMNDNGTYQYDDDFPIGPGSYNITGQLRLSNTYSDRKVPVSVSIEVIPEPAMIYYVDADANGVNDGSSWADAYNYLRDALAAASSGDEIWVAQGIYKPDQGAGVTPRHRGNTFQLKNGVDIKGAYAGFGEPDPNARDIDAYETILSGDLAGNDIDVNDPVDLLNEPTRSENSYHVLTGSGTDEAAVLDGFTITGGNANGSFPDNCGGGLHNHTGSPTITNCTFTANSASEAGGGMCNWSYSTPTLSNCAFSYNRAGAGGGMSNQHSSSSVLSNCTFSGNTSGAGGGIHNQYKSSPTITNCTFRENCADHGGGMLSYDGTNPTLENCMFSRNSAEKDGGGIFIGGSISSSSATLTNCTFSGNSALNGNALACGSWMARSNLELTNCILWDGGDEIWNNDGSTIIINYSDVQGGWLGDGNIDADPCFADGKNGNLHLKSQAGRWEANEGRWTRDGVTSPCIDAGNPASPVGHEPFPNGGIINMGAYGGTAEASKSYFGEPVCETIVAGDINGDCKVNFVDFTLMAFHWLEDNTPVSAVTTTYLFLPDPNALRTSGGFTGQGHGSYCVEGQFELTVDFCAGVAWFNRVDANTNCGESTYTVSLDALFHMSELVSTDVSEAAIDFVFEKNIPSFPGADVHLQVIFLDGSVQLVGSVCDAIYDGYCYHLDAVAVRKP